MIDDETIEEFRSDMAYVLSILGNSTIVTEPMTSRIKNGLYCVMKSYGLSFRICSRADWSWIEICESEDSKALNSSEITARDFNEGEFLDACKAIIERQAENDRHNDTNKPEFGWPAPNGDFIPEREHNGASEPKFGWLAPNGDFIPVSFGEHEYEAGEIISSKGWDEDFLLGYADKEYSPHAGDYLIQNRGYVLLHNPASPIGKPFVTKSETRPLTKAQKEFLYDYYMALGDGMSANMYIED